MYPYVIENLRYHGNVILFVFDMTYLSALLFLFLFFSPLRLINEMQVQSSRLHTSDTHALLRDYWSPGLESGVTHRGVLLLLPLAVSSPAPCTRVAAVSPRTRSTSGIPHGACARSASR